ncbi:MAG: DUF6580 family putative transport protein [Bacteroidota bacterium]
MKNTWFSPKMLLAYAVVLMVVLWRLFIEIPNFTPVMALAFFGGAYFGKRHIALIIPFAAMIISDLILGVHNTMIFVYLAFAIAVGIGTLIKNKSNVPGILAGALGSSIIFFLITNFGVWLTGFVGYPMTLNGLIASYVQAIPFFRTEVLSTLVFTTVFFGAYHLVKRSSTRFAEI